MRNDWRCFIRDEKQFFVWMIRIQKWLWKNAFSWVSGAEIVRIETKPGEQEAKQLNWMIAYWLRNTSVLVFLLAVCVCLCIVRNGRVRDSDICVGKLRRAAILKLNEKQVENSRAEITASKLETDFYTHSVRSMMFQTWIIPFFLFPILVYGSVIG